MAHAVANGEEVESARKRFRAVASPPKVDEVKALKATFRFHYTDTTREDEDYQDPEDALDTPPEAFLLFGGAPRDEDDTEEE